MPGFFKSQMQLYSGNKSHLQRCHELIISKLTSVNVFSWNTKATALLLLSVETGGAVGEGLCGAEEGATPTRLHQLLLGYA